MSASAAAATCEEATGAAASAATASSLKDKPHPLYRMAYLVPIFQYAIDQSSITQLLQLATLNMAFRQAVQTYVAPVVWQRALRYPGPPGELLRALAKHGDCSWVLAAMTVKGRWDINTGGGSMLELLIEYDKSAVAANAVRLGAHLYGSSMVTWVTPTTTGPEGDAKYLRHLDAIADFLHEILSSRRRPCYTNDTQNSQTRPLVAYFNAVCRENDRRQTYNSAVQARRNAGHAQPLLPTHWRLVLMMLRQHFFAQMLHEKEYTSVLNSVARLSGDTGLKYAGCNKNSTPLGAAILAATATGKAPGSNSNSSGSVRDDIVHWVAAGELRRRVEVLQRGGAASSEQLYPAAFVKTLLQQHVEGVRTPMEHVVVVARDVDLARFLDDVCGDETLHDVARVQALIEQCAEGSSAAEEDDDKKRKTEEVVAFLKQTLAERFTPTTE